MIVIVFIYFYYNVKRIISHLFLLKHAISSVLFLKHLYISELIFSGPLRQTVQILMLKEHFCEPSPLSYVNLARYNAVIDKRDTFTLNKKNSNLSSNHRYNPCNMVILNSQQPNTLTNNFCF